MHSKIPRKIGYFDDKTYDYLRLALPFFGSKEAIALTCAGVFCDDSLVEQIKNSAHSNDTILIRGESGTGKSTIAKIIHLVSNRRLKTFVPAQCPEFPLDTVASELLGSKKGAFTGAEDRKGYFESAQGGTIFLDEIGDMPLPVQAKLLGVLQEKMVVRLGGDPARPIKLDVRIVCATNRDLEELIKTKQFREDLYYRINARTIRLPPLREILKKMPRSRILELFQDFSRRSLAEKVSETIGASHDVESFWKRPLISC